MGSYWYDGGYDYGYMDLSVGGLFGGLFDGFGSLLGDFFYDDYYYGYDDYYYDYYGYGYGYDDYYYGYDDYDDVFSVDASDSLGDYSILDPLLGLLDDSYLSDDYLSVGGSSGAGFLGGLLDDISFLLGDLFSDSYYYGYDDYYGYDYYGYDDYDEVISTDPTDLLNDFGDLSVFDSILGLLGGDGTSFDFSSLLGLLGDGTSLSVDGEFDESILSSIIGLFGDDMSLSVDGEFDESILSSIIGLLGGDGTSFDLSSILGLLGDGTSLSVDGDLGSSSFLTSILGLFGGDGTSFDLSSILGLLGDGTSLSVDGDLGDSSFLTSILGLFGGDGTSFDLSSILGLLGGSGTSLSVDGDLGDSSFLTSILGLFGGDGTSFDLSSILGLLGDGTSLSVDGETTSSSSSFDLSSILGLLGGSGTGLSVDGTAASSITGLFSSLISLYSGMANMGNTASWDDLNFLDKLSLPSSESGTSFDFSSILGMLGGSGSSFDLSSILGLIGGGSDTTVSVDNSASVGSGTTIIADGETTASGSSAESSPDLSSILDLIGGSGTDTTVSVDGGTSSSGSGSGLDLTSILGLLGGSGSGSGSGLDLTSILGLLGGSGSSSSLTSILGLLGGSGSSSSLTSILGLLGGSGSGSGLLGNLISLYSGMANMGNTASWEDLDFLDNLTNTMSSSDDESGSGTGFDLSSILGLLGGSGSGSSLDLSSVLDQLEDAGASVTETTKTFAVTVTSPAETRNSSGEGLLRKAVVPQTASVLSWDDGDAAAEEGYWVEIGLGDGFDDAIRMFTAGTAFDLDGSAGIFSCRVTLKDGTFSEESREWTAESADAPRQIVSNANGRADIFFASPADGDVWGSGYYASNTLIGGLVPLNGKNRIRDTFSGSASDANILYLTDDANGDALFMDDVYSEFGSAARLDLIREIRSGSGDDVIDMTSDRYSAELADMTVRGGSGDDILWGADGGNMLFGDDGDDVIVGGSGDDVIAGGSGDDVLNGGGGSDVFTFGENWGDDVISQIGDGSVTLWFVEDDSKISISARNGELIFRNAAGTSSVTVTKSALANLTVLHGDDGAELFSDLSAAGAFLGSTAESVFETQSARANGILASL